MLQVDDQLPRRAVRISIPVHATAGSRRQLGLDVRVEQPDPVIPGLDMLPLMRETAADTIGINLQPLPCAVRHREKHNVLKIGSAAARLVRMAEAIDHIVVVVVARRGEIGVGTELPPPARRSRPPRFPSSDGRGKPAPLRRQASPHTAASQPPESFYGNPYWYLVSKERGPPARQAPPVSVHNGYYFLLLAASASRSSR